jgi:hypothetical protein
VHAAQSSGASSINRGVHLLTFVDRMNSLLSVVHDLGDVLAIDVALVHRLNCVVGDVALGLGLLLRHHDVAVLALRLGVAEDDVLERA